VKPSRPFRLGSPAGVAILAACTALLIFAGLWLRGLARTQGPPPKSLGRLPEFSLRDCRGRSWTRNDLLGRVWVADFQPARCASCASRALRMTDLQAALAKASGVGLVTFVTDPDFLGPGPMAELRRTLLAEPGKWIFLAGSPLPPSGSFEVVDGFGRIRGSFPEGHPAVSSEVLDCVGALLREQRLAASSGLQ